MCDDCVWGGEGGLWVCGYGGGGGEDTHPPLANVQSEICDRNVKKARPTGDSWVQSCTLRHQVEICFLYASHTVPDAEMCVYLYVYVCFCVCVCVCVYAHVCPCLCDRMYITSIFKH